MIVFDLKCGGGHVFEAWFASGAAFAEQQADSRVRCPVCDDADIVKAAMAPNVGAKGNRGAAPSSAVMKTAMRALAAAQQKALDGSTWVGTGFADRARAMHLGEESKAAIHGQATIAEAKALASEGVPVAPLPLPIVPPERMN